MLPTRKLFQVLVVRENQTLPSRWFPTEMQAQFFCSEYNRIVEQEAKDLTRATYQPVEVPKKNRPKPGLGLQYN